MSTIPPSNRAFGIASGVILLAIAALAWFVFGTLLTWAPAAGLACLLIALLVPGLLLPFNRLWLAFATRVGRFNSQLILALIFYLGIVPIGLMMRLLGRDIMHRRPEPDAASYWLPVRRQADAETLGDQF